MKKTKTGQSANLVLMITCAISGIALWVLATAVLTWQVLSGRLNDGAAQIVAISTQGIIAYILATLSRNISGKNHIAQAVSLLIYLFIQVILSLLFWGIDGIGLLRNCAMIAGGSLVSFAIYRLTHNSRKRSNHHKLYR